MTQKFINEIASKIYQKSGIETHTGWSQIRPRQITFWDFTIPEKIEAQVLEDLKPYHVGKLSKVNKVMNLPIIGSAINAVTGLEPIDMDKVPLTKKAKQDIGIYLGVIGKVSDGFMEDGTELL